MAGTRPAHDGGVWDALALFGVVLVSAPSTALRAVPLPRFAGEDQAALLCLAFVHLPQRIAGPLFWRSSGPRL